MTAGVPVTGKGGRLTPPAARPLVDTWPAPPLASAEEHAAMERHSAVREAVGLIVEGRPGQAQFVLARSVMRQARILGAGHVEVAPTCPCGGRCPAGRTTGGDER